MFCGGNHATALRAFDERSHKTPDRLRIFTERTNVDYWIRGIVVDVSYRRINLLHAERDRFVCRQCALSSRVIGIASCSDGHVPRHVNGVVVTAPPRPPP